MSVNYYKDGVLTSIDGGGGGEVDQIYDATSKNAQSGIAVAEALENVEIDVDDALSTTSENPVQNKVITSEVQRIDKFIGTVEEWESLSETEQSYYEGKEVIFTNDSEGGGSIKEPTELEKGIIGGDEWQPKSYSKGEIVIKDNKLLFAKSYTSNSWVDSEWQETSLKNIFTKLLSEDIPLSNIATDKISDVVAKCLCGVCTINVAVKKGYNGSNVVFELADPKFYPTKGSVFGFGSLMGTAADAGKFGLFYINVGDHKGYLWYIQTTNSTNFATIIYTIDIF